MEEEIDKIFDLEAWSSTFPKVKKLKNLLFKIFKSTEIYLFFILLNLKIPHILTASLNAFHTFLSLSCFFFHCAILFTCFEQTINLRKCFQKMNHNHQWHKTSRTQPIMTEKEAADAWRLCHLVNIWDGVIFKYLNNIIF